MRLLPLFMARPSRVVHKYSCGRGRGPGSFGKGGYSLAIEALRTAEHSEGLRLARIAPVE